MAVTLRRRKQSTPEEQEEKERTHAKTDAERLKLALWFIDKCGSTDCAERSLRAAIAALREMDRQG